MVQDAANLAPLLMGVKVKNGLAGSEAVASYESKSGCCLSFYT
jgi:hypothetical protein